MKVLWEVNEASLKKLLTLLFHLYEMSRIGKYMYRKSMSGFLGLRMAAEGEVNLQVRWEG